jgi:hypothetical protein
MTPSNTSFAIAAGKLRLLVLLAALTGLLVWGLSSDSPAPVQAATAACSDGKDNDSDGRIDFPADPGCESAGDGIEGDPACSNNKDDDSDGRTDFPNDPGCTSAQDGIEGDDGGGGGGGGNRQCSDGRDNDGDGQIDFPNDPGCSGPDDNSEANNVLIEAVEIRLIDCNGGVDPILGIVTCPLLVVLSDGEVLVITPPNNPD